MKNVVICETWTESERGWGTRPDGVSLHLKEEDCKEYIKDYWNTMPDEIQDEYSRPDGNLRSVCVSDEIYEDICNSKNGIRLWKNYNKLIQEEKLKAV